MCDKKCKCKGKEIARTFSVKNRVEDENPVFWGVLFPNGVLVTVNHNERDGDFHGNVLLLRDKDEQTVRRMYGQWQILEWLD